MQVDLQKIIREQELWQSHDRLAIAVSGGMDSMCALYLLEELGQSYVVLHCNFQLRGSQSDGDAAFVRKHAEQLAHCNGVFVEQFLTEDHARKHGLSLQAAARALRYDWFSTLHAQGLFDKLIVAHHRDDRLETFLINAYRVSGLRGLASIPTARDYIVRPLMSLDRESIQAFVKHRNIPYREDASNRSNHYLRNLLRNKVLPAMEAELPELRNRLNKTIQWLRSDSLLLDHFVEEARKERMKVRTDGGYSIDLQWVITYPQSAVFLYHLLDGYGFKLSQCHDILTSERVGSYVRSAKATLYRDRSELLLVLAQAPSSSIQVDGPGQFILANHLVLLEEKEGELTSERVHLSPDRYPLSLRTWQEEDYIRPLGMGGKRKLLSDLFTDLKLSPPDKMSVPLLCDGKEVLWIAGIRIAESLRTTAENPANLFLGWESPFRATMSNS